MCWKTHMSELAYCFRKAVSFIFRLCYCGISKMAATDSVNVLNRFDIKRLIFLRCRTCFCQNREKDVTKRYQRYTCLTSHNFLTFEPISKIIFVFSFRYIALSSSCIRYQFGQANKNSFALLCTGHIHK